MCTGTANTNFILRHTTTPPIPSTSNENFSGCHLWTTIFDTNIQYALHFSYLQGIARARDGEAPITNRRSVDMHSLEENNGERCLYSGWDCVGTMPTLRPRLYQSPTTHLPQKTLQRTEDDGVYGHMGNSHNLAAGCSRRHLPENGAHQEPDAVGSQVVRASGWAARGYPSDGRGRVPGGARLLHRLTPEDGQQIMLTIERLDDGEVSPYLTDELRVGDKLELRGSIGGYFVWEARLGGPLLLIAGRL